MIKERKKSMELSPVFNDYYPGAHSNFRHTPKQRLFAEKSKGSHVWDVDGNEYIEYNGAMGPTFIGHQHPEYVKALKDLLDSQAPLTGSHHMSSPEDIKAAEKICELIPCAEAVKFCITGSEAVQMAIRIARAYTGKQLVLRFDGHYHGWNDNVFGGQVNPDPNAIPYPVYPEIPVPGDLGVTLGRSENATKETFMILYNNIEILEKTIEKYADQIAIIHFEGIVCNHFNFRPRPGFLEKIRELCTKHNIVMSMDEVITGFRVGLHGAQGLLGVIPDICTMGKAIAGGVPMSCVAGKKEFMNVMSDRKVVGPGTFNGYALGMRAVVTTLDILSKDDGAVYRNVEKVQEKLVTGLLALAEKHGIPLNIQSFPGVFWLLFGIEPGIILYSEQDEAFKSYDPELQAKFTAGIDQEGILTLGARFYMNIQHTMEDVDKTLAAADIVLANMAAEK